MRNVVVMIVVIIVCAGVLLASGEPEAETAAEAAGYLENMTPPGVLPVVKETVTLSVLARADPSIENVETNWATQWIEEQTNVHLEWQNVQGGDASEKIRLILSSGTDLPDIILSPLFSPLQFSLFGSQGILLPLEGYIEDYGHWIKKAAAETPRVLTELVSADGHLYVIGNFEHGRHGEYQSKLWFNKTWLDKLDLPMPKTPDSLYSVYKAFKAKDPNGNGIADEIPLSGFSGRDITPFFLNAWLYADSDNRLSVVKGKVVPQFTQPEFREGLRYLNRLAEEGLLDPEAFVQGGSVLKQLVMGDHVRLGSFPHLVPAVVAPNSSEQTRNFVTLPPLMGRGGNNTTMLRPKPVQSQFGFAITKACEQPEVALRWQDFVYSHEAYRTQFYGEENVDWRPGQPGEVGINGNPAKYFNINVHWGKPQQNKIWFHTAPFYCPRDVFLGRSIDPNNPWFIAARLDRETVANYVGHEPDEVMPPNLPVEIALVDEYAELKLAVNEYVKQAIARFVVGDLDIENGWDDYLAQLKAMNLERYLEIVQATLDRMPQ